MQPVLCRFVRKTLFITRFECLGKLLGVFELRFFAADRPNENAYQRIDSDAKKGHECLVDTVEEDIVSIAVLKHHHHGHTGQHKDGHIAFVGACKVQYKGNGKREYQQVQKALLREEGDEYHTDDCTDNGAEHTQQAVHDGILKRTDSGDEHDGGGSGGDVAPPLRETDEIDQYQAGSSLDGEFHFVV